MDERDTEELDPVSLVEQMDDAQLPLLPPRLTELAKGMSIRSFRRFREINCLWGERVAELQIKIDQFYRKNGDPMRKAGKEDTVETLTGWIETRTPRAILFHSDFGPDDPDKEGQTVGWWIPTSQITRVEELEGGSNRVEIDVKSWLCQKNGFE